METEAGKVYLPGISAIWSAGGSSAGRQTAQKFHPFDPRTSPGGGAAVRTSPSPSSCMQLTLCSFLAHFLLCILSQSQKLPCCANSGPSEGLQQMLDGFSNKASAADSHRVQQVEVFHPASACHCTSSSDRLPPYLPAIEQCWHRSTFVQINVDRLVLLAVSYAGLFWKLTFTRGIFHMSAHVTALLVTVFRFVHLPNCC